MSSVEQILDIGSLETNSGKFLEPAIRRYAPAVFRRIVDRDVVPRSK